MKNDPLVQSTDYGLEELLQAAEADGDVRDNLREWYFKWTRLITLEETLKADASKTQEHLTEVQLRSAFGGHLRDEGAAVQAVEHFSSESVHSLQCRVVMPPHGLATASSEARSLARLLLSNRRRGQ